MALEEAYKFAEGPDGAVWIGPDSAKSNVDAKSGNVYLASDTEVDYYGDGGSWTLREVGSESQPVPAVHADQGNIKNLATNIKYASDFADDDNADGVINALNPTAGTRAAVILDKTHQLSKEISETRGGKSILGMGTWQSRLNPQDVALTHMFQFKGGLGFRIADISMDSKATTPGDSGKAIELVNTRNVYLSNLYINGDGFSDGLVITDDGSDSAIDTKAVNMVYEGLNGTGIHLDGTSQQPRRIQHYGGYSYGCNRGIHLEGHCTDNKFNGLTVQNNDVEGVLIEGTANGEPLHNFFTGCYLRGNNTSGTASGDVVIKDTGSTNNFSNCSLGDVHIENVGGQGPVITGGRISSVTFGDNADRRNTSIAGVAGWKNAEFGQMKVTNGDDLGFALDDFLDTVILHSADPNVYAGTDGQRDSVVHLKNISDGTDYTGTAIYVNYAAIGATFPGGDGAGPAY